MSTSTQYRPDILREEIEHHRQTLRRFEVVGVEFITPGILGIVTLSVLLLLGKGWLLSLCGAAVAIGLAGFVTRRFFVH